MTIQPDFQTETREAPLGNAWHTDTCSPETCSPETSCSETCCPEVCGTAPGSVSAEADRFVLRQRRLTGLVKELSDPEQADVFPLVVGVSNLESQTVLLHIPTEPPEDAIDMLFGFIAPDTWDGLLVVANGRAYSAENLEDFAEVTADDVVIGYGQGRLGEEVSVLHLEEETLISSLSAEGRVLDCCRRAFGLETPPAKDTIAELFISSWLSRIFKSLIEAPPSWESFAKLHPLLGDNEDHSPAELGELASKICARGSWDMLREAIATGELPHSSISSDQAEWMDDSMFSRWCLAAFPDTGELLAQLSEMLPLELYQMIEECVEEQRAKPDCYG